MRAEQPKHDVGQALWHAMLSGIATTMPGASFFAGADGETLNRLHGCLTWSRQNPKGCANTPARHTTLTHMACSSPGAYLQLYACLAAPCYGQASRAC